MRTPRRRCRRSRPDARRLDGRLSRRRGAGGPHCARRRTPRRCSSARGVASFVATLSQGLLYGPAGEETAQAEATSSSFYADVRLWYGRRPASRRRRGMDVPSRRNASRSTCRCRRAGIRGFRQRAVASTTFTAFNCLRALARRRRRAGPGFRVGRDERANSKLSISSVPRDRGRPRGRRLDRAPRPRGGQLVPAGGRFRTRSRSSSTPRNPRPAREIRLVHDARTRRYDPRSFRLGEHHDRRHRRRRARRSARCIRSISTLRGARFRVRCPRASTCVRYGDVAPAVHRSGERASCQGRRGSRACSVPARAASRAMSGAAPGWRADGARVVASARILLDSAATIDTPAFAYTLDLAPPQTTTTATLIAGRTTSRLLGSRGRGLRHRHATVYVAEDGGELSHVARPHDRDAGRLHRGAGARYGILRSPHPLNAGATAKRRRPGSRRPTTAPSSISAAAPSPRRHGPSRARRRRPPADARRTRSSLRRYERRARDPLERDRPAAYVAPLAPSRSSVSCTASRRARAVGALAVVGLADGSIVYSAGPDRSWLLPIRAGGTQARSPFTGWRTRSHALARMRPGAVGDDGRRLARQALTLNRRRPLFAPRRVRHPGPQPSSRRADRGSTGEGVRGFRSRHGSFRSWRRRRLRLAVGRRALWGNPARSRPRYRFVERPDGSLEATIVRPRAAARRIAFGARATRVRGPRQSSPRRRSRRLAALRPRRRSRSLLAIATGPVRGKAVGSPPTGGIVVAHSLGLERRPALRAPVVLATSIETGAVVPRPVFDLRGFASRRHGDRGSGQRRHPENTRSWTSRRYRPDHEVAWDERRHRPLRFEPLERGAYVVRVSENLRAPAASRSRKPRRSSFTRIEDVTLDVSIVYRDTRRDRLDGTSPTRRRHERGRHGGCARRSSSPRPGRSHCSGTPSTASRARALVRRPVRGARPRRAVAPGESALATAVSFVLPDQRAAFAHGVRAIAGATNGRCRGERHPPPPRSARSTRTTSPRRTLTAR